MKKTQVEANKNFISFVGKKNTFKKKLNNLEEADYIKIKALITDSISEVDLDRENLRAEQLKKIAIVNKLIDNAQNQGVSKSDIEAILSSEAIHNSK